jgi:hypothetical protein
MVEKIGDMDMDSFEREANLMALKELVKPDGLGRFLVLIQQKGAGVRSFEELIPDASRIQSLDAPILKAEHTPLHAGRFPQTEFTLDQLWPFDQDDK